MYAMRGRWLKWQTFVPECENLAEKRKSRKLSDFYDCYERTELWAILSRSDPKDTLAFVIVFTTKASSCSSIDRFLSISA
jgi:hypothetical protein